MQEIQNTDDETIMLGASNTSKEQQEENVEETTTENTVLEEEKDATVDSCEVPFDVSVEENVEAKDKTVILMESLEHLNEKVDQMNRLFEQKIAHTLHEEKIVDQMHAELQKYKQDMYSQLVRPILMDIIEVRDSILRMSANYASKPEGEQDVPLKVFRDYAFDMQDILEKNNITIYDGVEGEIFNPTKQKAIKKVTTPVEDLHGKIAESLSSGYEYLGKPISPEKVAVYVYQKTEETEEA